ncbi:unnamed protein product [Arabidopsis halleri]
MLSNRLSSFLDSFTSRESDSSKPFLKSFSSVPSSEIKQDATTSLNQDTRIPTIDITGFLGSGKICDRIRVYVLCKIVKFVLLRLLIYLFVSICRHLS